MPKEITIEEKERREHVLSVSGKFFEEYGKELSPENGEALERDRRRPEWSVDVMFLTKSGIVSGYYRPENEAFTIVGFAPFDIFTKDAPMVSNKFITKKQLEELKKLL